MGVDTRWVSRHPAGIESANSVGEWARGASPAGGLAPVGQTMSSGSGSAGFAWVAAHGGCGASTLSSLLGGVDLGCRWPDSDRAEPARVLLVARTHAHGLQAASRTLNAMREGRHPSGIALVGVVLVADAPGALPRSLVNRIRVMRSIASVHRIPWVPQWRLGEQPKRLPRQLETLEGRLRELGATLRGWG
ncbi:DUF6668 family protein [Micromonospora sp. NPDC050397]|uniref:DUF6668 family protein n=1 Tax=Micromonospora sp. NPDC050397 TaxID=3364279 RepID=UPI00384F937F